MKGNKIGMNLVNEVKMKIPGFTRRDLARRPCQKARIIGVSVAKAMGWCT
jgi:hypothetical protein